MENNFKSGFVSLIGRPNVGKSTLLNNILKDKVVITSPKPQTTRNTIRCIYTDDNSQIIFLDNPGFTKARTKLGNYMNESIIGSLVDTEVILFLIEPEEKLGKTDLKLIELLKSYNLPIIAVINKIDTVNKEELLGIIEKLNEYDLFNEIIPISALKGDGTSVLLDEIKKLLPEGPQYFPEEMIIDQSERFIIAEIIREKILRLTNEEIPHGTAVEVTSMKKRPGKDIIDIDATIFCEKKSHKRILIGKNGSMLKKIGTQARKDIEFFLKERVYLDLWVKVRENWRDKAFDLSDLGYKN